MGIKDLGIKYSYTGKGSKILHDFLLPVLSVAQQYDRITGYYTMESLLAISQGIESLYENSGKMRLIIGIHSFPNELVEASLQREFMAKQIAVIRDKISKKLLSISDALEKKRLATLSWMLEDGLLEVKAASVKGEGIFHPKTCILTDQVGDKVIAVGSPNETGNGLGGNFEQLLVLKSWETPEGVMDQEEFFNSLWENRAEDACVIDISEETAEMLQGAFGREYPNPNKNNFKAQSNGIIAEASKMPANFFVSGDIPALYMHQERAVIDALSRWPVRVLFADEVGLGKTFEVAATVAFLVKYCNIKRVVILTPKSVLQQWQDELKEHFGINMWLYDSNSKSYISAEHEICSMRGKNPLGPSSPNMILMSAQLARGSRSTENLFNQEDTVLPDVLVVDEAHSARISRDLSGNKKKTRMYKMLEECCFKIPHLILATATPMQKEAEEYHAILKLLGLPKPWVKERNYKTSLKIIGRSDIPDSTDSNTAAGLLNATMNYMKPDLTKLSSDEQELVQFLVDNYAQSDSYDRVAWVQSNWPVFRRIFIKLHPAHLLTVRNTRRALTEVGYKFPQRNLREVNILNSDRIQLFYSEVNDYITTNCFRIEHVLNPDKKLNTGFVRISYQQRVASSLYSCKKSLERRYKKALEVREAIDHYKTLSKQQTDSFEADTLLDDSENDELLNVGDEAYDIIGNQTAVNIEQLKRAVYLECTSLHSLVQEAEMLLKEYGDMKVSNAIEKALKCLEDGDKVLLFSRYTDTIDALIIEFKKRELDKKFVYGVYTGQQSNIVSNGIEEMCDKNRIKTELFANRLKIVFCSDAASEGLNLQAARVLINVDVPWTPSRLEQRIGRIARLGQVADEVDIYNVWYPNSIEARMYHRIQTRLEETNLAIGEFPEVVANSIKQAILDDTTEDSSAKMLKELRNDYQRKALEELWTDSDEKVTSSDIMRKQLLHLCSENFECVDTLLDHTIYQFRLPDGTTESYTEQPGMQESISLKSRPWVFIDFKIPELTLIKDDADRDVAFTMETFAEDQYIKHEKVLELIDNDMDEKEMITVKRPTMLPNTFNLNLEYAVESSIENTPLFWKGDDEIE